MDSIVFVVAHPDDLAYCMGGTACLLKDKYKLYDLCLTKGVRAFSDEPDQNLGLIRAKEEEAACKIINAELKFLDLVDGYVYADRQICESVAEIFKSIQPMAVFSLWPVDSHQDHAAVSEISRKALQIAKLKAEFYMAEASMFSQTSQFHPDIYVDISEIIEKKIEVIRCHESQNRPTAYSKYSLEELCLRQFSFRGAECGCKYAEGFKTMRPITGGKQSVLFTL